jgi:acetylornithine deacetylase/succinyl-diaminopimelate desuccinylase-like protein
LRLTERDGRLFACDAKGAIAAMVEAGRLLYARREALRDCVVRRLTDQIDIAAAMMPP